MRIWVKGVIPIAGILLVSSSGCTHISGIKPVQPKFGQMVSDVQPLLEWEAAADSDITYDLLITEKTSKGLAEKKSYYREGLRGTSHKIDEPALKPGTTYDWAVRTRKGEKLGEWNKQETTLFLLLYYHHATRSFEFKTP